MRRFRFRLAPISGGGLAALFCLIIAFVPARAEEPMVRQSFDDGLISVLIPVAFKRLSSEIVALKYRGRNPPKVAYGTATGAANVVARLMPTRFGPDQLNQLIRFMHEDLNTHRPGITWNSSGIREINGRKFAVLDFESQAIDSRIRNIMAFTSARGRLLIVSFNATVKLVPRWLPSARKTIASIVIKE